MNWRGKLQTPQFNAHNKLCFDKIVLPIRYKVYVRQIFWIAIPSMTRAKLLCVLQQSENLVTCVTWTKKSSLGLRSLAKTQNYARLKPHKMLTPIKTQWAYLISTLQCLIVNCAAIYYMYGPITDVGVNIKK